MMLTSLPRVMIEPTLRRALEEDLGLAGDITSATVIPLGHHSVVTAVARSHGVIAGLDCAELACAQVDPAIVVTRHVDDGAKVEPGTHIASFQGPSRSLLTAERTALNFLGHLSGIATVTAELVDAVAGSRAAIVCTRKTTPGLRALEIYAVRAGGGIAPALTRARDAVGHFGEGQDRSGHTRPAC